MYRVVFNVPHDPMHPVIDKRGTVNRIPDSFALRTIRSISIYSFEPFGTRITDTVGHPRSFVQKAGNALHMRTLNSVVRNYLLFNEGQPLDLFTVSESERLLRQSQFMRDAVIFAYPVHGTRNCDEEWQDQGCPRDRKGGCSLAIHAEANAVSAISLSLRFISLANADCTNWP